MNLKTALIFGSSGLTGKELLHFLVYSGKYQKVKVFVRNPIHFTHPNLEVVTIDFDKIETFSDEIRGDDLFLCLGTTKAKAGSRSAFYKVDYTYTLKIASIAKANGIKQVLLISSMGADDKSWIYYSRVKGKIEKSLSKLGFDSLSIIRPSLLLGERNERRRGEQVAVTISTLFPGVYAGPLKKYKPISAHDVAKSMLYIAKKSIPGKNIYESNRLRFIADTHQ